MLCRDKFSLLAALCTDEPPVAPDATGSFFIERDACPFSTPVRSRCTFCLATRPKLQWWIFRHVLHWLRTGALPDDPLLLEELHAEAGFYRLYTLREACESARRRV